MNNMKKKLINYAMVAINTKYDDEDKLHVRRVLISYKRKKVRSREFFGEVWSEITYKGTKIIATDPYFLSNNKTHIYEFKDNYYRLIKVDESNPNKILYELAKGIYSKRKYHCSTRKVKAIEFESDSVIKAIEQFNNRKELK